MYNLAAALGEKGDYDAAKAMFEELLPVPRRVLGEQHPDTLSAMQALALMRKKCDERRTHACGNCGSTRNLKVCRGCRVVRYCNDECQRQAWKAGHKKECKEIRQRNADEARK